MFKGVAVQKIILLILGIIVLAIVGYLLYVVFIGGKPTRDVCNAALISACGQCKVSGWDSNKDVIISGAQCSEDMLTKEFSVTYKGKEDTSFKISCGETTLIKACSLRGIQ
ncbi:MAG: hypothetical protein QXG91_00680 [Candidatus Aenigmatarchaeota archaeon]